MDAKEPHLDSPEVIDLSSSTDDEDDDAELKRAIALSLEEQTTAGKAKPRPSMPLNRDQNPKSPCMATFGSLLLDRKTMEFELCPQKTSTTIREANTISSRSILPFPTGTVKRTWTHGQERRGDDIKIEEVFQRSELKLAVLASFQWDDDWLLSKINLSQTRLICVAFARDEAHIVFIIDLPRLETDGSFEPTLFSQELFRFLGALGLDENLVRSLENYDFTATKRYGFVHTMYEHAILQGT
ncbi:unnamed protein product [Parascedosporium putredinis]|uniref:Uncharacterized protein n=1 Tax=Parascedosporium putredinis TaxID=1442378 RepID=A0A9P1M5V8_9PEZI|nr:unnamed protein product [Parascedosporium putredinis]CAI7988545.1 unnamed protein product [Parascedosporium putredinis]